MPSLPETVTKSKQFPMWVGSPSDLKRLLRLIEKQYEPLLPAHTAEQTRHAREMLDLSNPPAEKARWEERLQRDEEKANRAANFEVVLTNRDNETRSVTGAASEITDYIEGRRFDEMDISAPSGNILGHRISLRATRKHGLYARISSSDSKWCLATYAEVNEEIRRQVPPWRFIRTGWFWWLLGSLLWVAFTLTVDIVPDEGIDTPTQILLVFLGGLAGSVLIGMGILLGGKLIPAFELTEPGRRSRGKAALAILGSVASALVLGVAGNAIYQVLVG